MSSLNFFLFFIVVLVAFFIVLASAKVQHIDNNNNNNNNNVDETVKLQGNVNVDFHHGKKRAPYSHVPHFPWGKPRAAPFITCDTYPRICRARLSPGPDCCNHRCVDLKTDIFNCGACGTRCTFPEMCCSGECVNLFNDDSHCGNCYTECAEGSSCIYGMCNYA